MNINTVGELKRVLEDEFDDDMPLVFVEHPHRGSSVTLSVDDYGSIRAQKEQGYSGELGDPEDFAVFSVVANGVTGNYFECDDEEEVVWPGRDAY